MKKRDDKKDADDPLADLPFWLEDFKDNLVNTELHALAHNSRESDLEHPVEVVTDSRKHSICTHFPERPKLRRLLENQNDKGFLQKTQWRSPTSCRKVW